MAKRAFRLYAALALAATAGESFVLAAEEADVLFFAPFEDAADAAIAAADGSAKVTAAVRFGEGVRGKAALVGPDCLLAYALKGNVVLSEGTIMMWIKPEWRSDDGKFHNMFRASTGNFGGKALNAIMLYKYLRGDKLLIYTSNGAETAPHEGRTMARADNLQWQPGHWVHLAATWSSTLASTDMALYLDGKRVGTSAGAVFVPDQAPDTFSLGGPAGAGATWFDDVLVFSRPLLAREVAAIHAAYAGQSKSTATALPFTSSREVQLCAYVCFGTGRVVVEADFRAARRELAGQSGTVEVVALRGREIVRTQAKASASGMARIALDYDEVGAGPCTLRATLRGQTGKPLRTGELRFDVPKEPAWLHNSLGKTDDVVQPWTPLRVDGSAVEVWGRRYVYEAGPLPTEVVSQGQSMLRRPIELAVRASGKLATLQARPAEGSAHSDGALVRRWHIGLGPLEGTAASHTEFDGFVRVKLDLAPRGATSVDDLRLVVPLRPDSATLYHHANGSWTTLSDAGAVGPQAWSKPLPFVPYVWLGTEALGLAWFCEHNNNWHNGHESRAIEIVHGDEGVDLTVRFIDRPTTLDKPLRLEFGFMATPVKPMPKRWRDWRQMFISALRLDAFAKSGWAAPGCRNIGVLWNNHVGSFSHLPTQPEEMAGKVKLLRANGWDTVLSYYALNYTQTNKPEFAKLEREWRRNPYHQCPLKADACYGSVCNASTWADFLLYVIDRTMDLTGTDGVYLDCSNPNFCKSTAHGCAPGRYPIFATRDLQRRIYTLVKNKRGERGFVYNHNSENHIITTFAFSDAVLNGEQYNRKDLRSLTFEKFRAEMSPQPYGVPMFLLPTLTKFQPKKREKMPGAEFLAFPLLHDVICVPPWLSRDSQKLLKRAQAIVHGFGAADAEFLPYWDNGREIAASPAGATISAYLRRDGKALLLIAQATKGPGTFELNLLGRLAALRGRPALSALSHEPLSWHNGRLRWSLPGRQVQLAVVGAD